MARLNENFIFQQIRRYNIARRQTYKDAALTAIGVHAGLIQKRVVAIRDLTDNERSKIVEFVNNFCETQELTVRIRL